MNSAPFTTVPLWRHADLHKGRLGNYADDLAIIDLAFRKILKRNDLSRYGIRRRSRIRLRGPGWSRRICRNRHSCRRHLCSRCGSSCGRAQKIAPGIVCIVHDSSQRAAKHPALEALSAAQINPARPALHGIGAQHVSPVGGKGKHRQRRSRQNRLAVQPEMLRLIADLIGDHVQIVQIRICKRTLVAGFYADEQRPVCTGAEDVNLIPDLRAYRMTEGKAVFHIIKAAVQQSGIIHVGFCQIAGFFMICRISGLASRKVQVFGSL